MKKSGILTVIARKEPSFESILRAQNGDGHQRPKCLTSI